MSDKATPAFVQQLIARMGKSGDAAGILTLFAHMAELEIRLTAARAAKLDSALLNTMWTDIRAGKLDNLDALISSRAPATTALLNTMWTDARAAKLDLVGTNADAAGTTTLFARLAQIAGYTDQVESFVDTLETNLGTTGDAANAAGTVLARLAELLTNRLTSTRAGYLDAAISTAKNTVTVQRGYTSLPANTNTTTAAITSVDTGKSFISSSSEGDITTNVHNGHITARLTDSITVSFSRLGGATGNYGAGTIAWEVVQIA